MVSGEEDGTQRINVEVSLTIDHDGLADFATAVTTSWQQRSECTLSPVSPDGYNYFLATKNTFMLNYQDNDRGTGFECILAASRVCVTLEDAIFTWNESKACEYLPTGWGVEDVVRLDVGTPDLKVYRYPDGDMAGNGTPHTTIPLTGLDFSGLTVTAITTSTTHFWVLEGADTLYGFKISDGSLEYTHEFAAGDGLLIAYNANSDELLVFDKTTNLMYEIDPLTGTINSSAEASSIPDSALGMTYDSDNDKLYYGDSANVYSLAKAEGGILSVSDAAAQSLLTALGVILATPTEGGTGINTDIDTVSEPLVVASTPCKSVIVTAHPDNDDLLWVGIGAAVTDEGVHLNAGDSVTLWISDVNKIYVLGGAVNQKASWVFVN